MSSAVGELEVVARTSNPEHDAVEPFMVFEAADNAKTKALTVHGPCARQVGDRAGYSQMRRHGVWVEGVCSLEGLLPIRDVERWFHK